MAWHGCSSLAAGCWCHGQLGAHTASWDLVDVKHWGFGFLV
jgi:hypothetical protein